MKLFDPINRTTNLMQGMNLGKNSSPTSIVESKFLAHNGKCYGIVRENSIYVLKVSENIDPQSSNDFEYIGGVRNREKYASKSINELQKKFNIMDIEFKRTFGENLLNNTKQALQEKYVLKMPKQDSGSFDMDTTSFPDMGNKKKIAE